MKRGVKDAADKLLARVRLYLRSSKICSEDVDLMVRAYANLRGLGQACVQSGKTKHAADLGLFAVGFTKRQALFDFIDVGAGKERADNKIRGMYAPNDAFLPLRTNYSIEVLSFHMGNGQCQHVILGCSHDGGYAPSLERFAADDSTRERITLLKGGPIHPQIASLGFTRTLKLKTVFGMEDTKKVGGFPNPGVSPASYVPRPVVPSLTSASFPANASTSGPKHLNPAAHADRLGPVLRHASGKRIDKQLAVDPTTPYLQVLKKANLCSWYYLRGECTGCSKNHFVGPLTPREFDCLWYLTRAGLCFQVRKGKDCDDPKCIYGHREG